MPDNWKNAVIDLILKKIVKADGPISFIPTIYKEFTYTLLRRILSTLERHQPKEQVEFKSGFSITDHIKDVNQLKHNFFPLCFAYVDDEKLFNFKFTPLFAASNWTLLTSHD